MVHHYPGHPAAFLLKRRKILDCCDTAGVMGLMSVWVGGLDKPCTGQFGASAMASMPMPATAAIEHPLKSGESNLLSTLCSETLSGMHQ